MKFQDIIVVIWEPILKVVLIPFWWIIVLIIIFSVPVLRVWWWLFTPLILAIPLKNYYLWWIGWDYWYQKHNWVMLELIPPKEVLVPFSAMEDVFNVTWSIVDAANWREVWCEGELPKFPFWASWEIVSIEGKIHFYLRCLAEHVHIFESVLYSHYPELEIRQVSDYTKNVPQNIPNEEWDLYGEDYVLGRSDFYPIKTYSKFFEPQGERIAKEEKRIDPITSLLEGMSRLGPGEQAWFQMITTPITSHDIDWISEAKEEIVKLSRRPRKRKKSAIELAGEIINTIVYGIVTPRKEGEEIESVGAIPMEVTEGGEREMIITPGEREILSAIEEKIKKPAYKVNLRSVYIAKKNAWHSPHGKLVRSYLVHFSTQNLNYIRFHVKTRTKIHYILRARRKKMRQRKIFMLYIKRLPPLYPQMREISAILNTEELATIFHFPTKISGVSVPGVAGVEAKKGGPPPNLPVEE